MCSTSLMSPPNMAGNNNRCGTKSCGRKWVSLYMVRHGRGGYSLGTQINVKRIPTNGRKYSCILFPNILQQKAHSKPLPKSLFPQILKNPPTRFGTRGSEVQILSPRPFKIQQKSAIFDVHAFSRERACG